MNSTSIQDALPDVYKKFFNEHDMVLNAPSILTWGADISHGMSTTKIKQKLPMKIFCGGNLNTSPGVVFGSISEFSASDTSFKTREINTYLGENSINISQFLETFLIESGYTGGIKIDILSEYSIGHGFDLGGTLSVIVTFLFFILVGKLDPKILIYEELDAESVLFEEIYIFSLQLSNKISFGKNAGASNYATMLKNASLPIIHFSQKCQHTSDIENGNIMNEGNNDMHVCIHDTIYKNTLIEFLGKQNDHTIELPIDYCVLFSGIIHTDEEIQSTRKQHTNEMNELKNFMQETVRMLPIHDTGKSNISELLRLEEKCCLDKEVDAVDIKVLEGFYHLFQDISSTTSANIFISIMQKIGLVSFSFEIENELLFAIQYLFHKYKQFGDVMVGILPFNTGKTGGSFLVVMKKGNSQETLDKVLDQLRNDGYTTSLDYASWRDGYCSDGVQLKQYISNKIYSPYTQKGELLFVDTNEHSYTEEYTNIIRKEQDCILLDTIARHIYIQGVKLTSKDIHSQNTTIDMLKLLMENPGKDIQNSRLPVSSYSQNKNELLTKVIIPIKKITQDHFGIELQLSCSGGTHEYYIRLDIDPHIPIGIIKKMYI